MKIRIGKRVIKSSIAVLFCFLIHIILLAIEHIFNIDHVTNGYAPANWYTPFFAAIATVYAMQTNPKGSKSQAKIRSIGSVIGGYFGAVIIFIFESIYKAVNHLDALDFTALSSNIVYYVFLFLITSIGILFLIPLTVNLGFRSATFISCLTFLSVTVSIRNGHQPVFLFATNRILSTVIGVLISLGINSIKFHHKHNDKILFISSVDNALLKENKELSPFTKYEMNNLISRGCSLTFMSARALTSILTLFKDINLNKKVITMNGCNAYDPLTRTSNPLVMINSSDREKIEEVLNRHNVNYFTYMTNENKLNCLYNSLSEAGSRDYFEKRRHGVVYPFCQAVAPKELAVSQYMVVLKEDLAEKIYNELNLVEEIKERVIVVKNEYLGLAGYEYLKITSVDARKEVALEKVYDRKEYDFLFCVGSGRTDLEVMKMADYAVCLNNAPDYVKEEADYIIPSSEPDDLLRFIDKVYSSSNYKKTLDKYKNNKKGE